MSEILSEREAEEWWRWMARVGAQESNSLRVSHEALRARVAEYLHRAEAAEARLAEVEAERDAWEDRCCSADGTVISLGVRLAEVEQALRELAESARAVVRLEHPWRRYLHADAVAAVLDKGEQPDG